MSSDNSPMTLEMRVGEVNIGLAISGAVIMALVLLSFAYVAWFPPSRKHINRVSFRLLVYAMVSSIIYACCLVPTLKASHPSAACTATTFLTSTSLMFSAGMLCSISLNLQLVLVHGVDGRMMEKYYVFGCAFLSAVCNITPLAAGQLGFIPAYGICWFNNPNDAIQFRWVIGAQSFWILLMASMEVVSFVVLACFMMRNQRRSTRILSNTTASLQRIAPTPPILLYRGIILRIGLYPLCSCLLNFSGCILDLYLANHTNGTLLGRILNSMDLLVYAVRTLVYALLAATDPSFLRALHALRAKPAASTMCSARQTANTRTVHTQYTQRSSCGSTPDRPLVGARADGDVVEKPIPVEPAEDARTDPEQGHMAERLSGQDASEAPPEGIACQI
ncbi:hypothetical protein B0H17DRAFT_1193288 [Mycena rosella]|uniref:G-protein coupled receptors family 2 profile 2 domain-containing protein n=1 Tax=Mycena rosella TaxID=1033263 RepID=A0AAD7GT39_MYCRO|nr:hypothetical protein B0H17DRAFT_1193288 [Mycena rosella]